MFYRFHIAKKNTCNPGLRERRVTDFHWSKIRHLAKRVKKATKSVNASKAVSPGVTAKTDTFRSKCSWSTSSKAGTGPQHQWGVGLFASITDRISIRVDFGKCEFSPVGVVQHFALDQCMPGTNRWRVDPEEYILPKVLGDFLTKVLLPKRLNS